MKLRNRKEMELRLQHTITNRTSEGIYPRLRPAFRRTALADKELSTKLAEVAQIMERLADQVMKDDDGKPVQQFGRHQKQKATAPVDK